MVLLHDHRFLFIKLGWTKRIHQFAASGTASHMEDVNDVL